MNVRLLPALLAFVIASGLLFGGYFFYQAYAVDNPVEKGIAETEGVAEAAVETTRNRIDVTLRLTKNADLRSVYRHIADLVGERGSGRELSIKLEQDSSPGLEQIWHSALFDVAEAMENRKYGDLPGIMNRLGKEFPRLSTELSMDETAIYISLYLDDASLHKVLPLSGGSLGVWPNGQVR